MLLFAREIQQDAFGTAPYLFLGPATYVSHEGERPIAISWQPKHPMSTDLFQAAPWQCRDGTGREQALRPRDVPSALTVFLAPQAWRECL